MPVPPGVLGKKLCRLGDAHPRSLKLTSWMRLLKPVITLTHGEQTEGGGGGGVSRGGGNKAWHEKELGIGGKKKSATNGNTRNLCSFQDIKNKRRKRGTRRTPGTTQRRATSGRESSDPSPLARGYP